LPPAAVRKSIAAMRCVSIADHLEADRLERRSRRLELVMLALEGRALHRHAVAGFVPRPLERAIADFRLELGAVRRRLDELRDG
jgi:hypothetical protein